MHNLKLCGIIFELRLKWVKKRCPYLFSAIKTRGIYMTNIEKKVKAFAKKASTVEHSGEIAYIVTRSDIVELNKSIESKIRQNERERTASMHAASRCIVGGK